VNALVADDDAGTRLLLRRVLEQDMSCTVIEVTNGADALDRLNKNAIDFAVLDLQMPVMNGIETLRAIRASAAFSQLPVMVLTSETTEAVVRHVVALGITDYLAKPLDRKAIRDRVERVIASLTARRSAPPAA
jgi:two-component system chemotaxis response regulator CheY